MRQRPYHSQRIPRNGSRAMGTKHGVHIYWPQKSPVRVRSTSPSAKLATKYIVEISSLGITLVPFWFNDRAYWCNKEPIQRHFNQMVRVILLKQSCLRKHECSLKERHTWHRTHQQAYRRRGGACSAKQKATQQSNYWWGRIGPGRTKQTKAQNNYWRSLQKCRQQRKGCFREHGMRKPRL